MDTEVGNNPNNTPDPSPAVDVSTPSTDVQGPEGTGGAVEQRGADELIAGKFRTQEELVKSYEESQRRMHELSQENAELKRVQSSAPETTPPAALDSPPTQQPEELSSDALLDKLLTDPQSVIQQAVNPELTQLRNQVQQLGIAYATERARQTIPNFDAVQGELRKIVQDNPGACFNPDGSLRPDGLDIAYQIYEGREIIRLKEEAKRAGKGEVVSTVKPAPFVETGGPAAPPGPSMHPDERGFAKAFGIPEAEWLKEKQRIQEARSE